MLPVCEPAAREQNGQILIGMRAAIAHATAGDDHRVVEQGPARRVFHGFELVEKQAEVFHLVLLDDGQPVYQFGQLAVVGILVVIRIQSQIRGLDPLSDFQRGDPSRIRLECQRDEIVHQRQGLDKGAVLRHVHRHFGLGFVQPHLGHAQLLLHRAHRGQILVQLFSVLPAQLALKRPRLAHHRVQNAAVLIECYRAPFLFLGIRIHEQRLKHLARIVDRRHANARARPAHFAVPVDAHIQRREARRHAHMLCGLLVDRDIALGHHRGLFNADPAQKRVRGAMPAGHAVVQIGKHGKIAPMRLQRLQQGRKRVIRAGLCGEKPLGDHPKRIANAHQPLGRLCTRKGKRFARGRPHGQHRVQKRQGQTHASTS